MIMGHPKDSNQKLFPNFNFPLNQQLFLYLFLKRLSFFIVFQKWSLVSIVTKLRLHSKTVLWHTIFFVKEGKFWPVIDFISCYSFILIMTEGRERHGLLRRHRGSTCPNPLFQAICPIVLDKINFQCQLWHPNIATFHIYHWAIILDLLCGREVLVRLYSWRSTHV